MSRYKIGVRVDCNKKYDINIGSKFEEACNVLIDREHEDLNVDVATVDGYLYRYVKSNGVMLGFDWTNSVYRIELDDMSEHELIVNKQSINFDYLEECGFEMILKPERSKIWAIDDMSQVLNELNIEKNKNETEKFYAVGRLGNVAVALLYKGNHLTKAIVQKFNNGEIPFKI